MDCLKTVRYLEFWLKNELEKTGQKGFVIGVSGGVDSAVVSTLCARTMCPCTCLSLPINYLNTRVKQHLMWLEQKYPNVEDHTIELTEPYKSLMRFVPLVVKDDLTLANTQARLRMTALYMLSGSKQYLVVGTGNRIEDFGIGFFSKYGDGAVDLSPIGNLMKSDVFALAKYLGIVESIQRATPTDGLWDDSRSDETQIGASYADLEWAMTFCGDLKIETWVEYQKLKPYLSSLFEDEEKVLKIYLQRHEATKHKMRMPPIPSMEFV